MLDREFEDWITETGTGKVAKLLNTTPVTVRRWRLGTRLPNLNQMKVIKKITKGRISYDKIIEGSCATVYLNGGYR